MTDCKVTVSKVVYLSSYGMEGLCSGVPSFPFFSRMFREGMDSDLKGADWKGLNTRLYS